MFSQYAFSQKAGHPNLFGKLQTLLGDVAELLALALFVGFIAMLANGLSVPLPV